MFFHRPPVGRSAQGTQHLRGTRQTATLGCVARIIAKAFCKEHSWAYKDDTILHSTDSTYLIHDAFRIPEPATENFLVETDTLVPRCILHSVELMHITYSIPDLFCTHPWWLLHTTSLRHSPNSIPGIFCTQHPWCILHAASQSHSAYSIPKHSQRNTPDGFCI